MAVINPFGGYVVNPERADDIIAPAYDSMTVEERSHHANSNPDNYLNAMRTREDYPADAEIGIGEILATNRRNIEHMVATRGFVEIGEADFFVYRLIHGEHRQTGLVAEIPVVEIDEGRVLKHEQTRADHEELLVEYQETVGASSSPVALAYQAVDGIREILDSITADTEPFLDHQTDDGVRQILWRVNDETRSRRLVEAFTRVPVTYLTDGHHRSASASRYVARLKQEDREPEQDGAWNHLLVALFPHDELRIFPFHRLVHDLGDTDAAGILERLRETFTVTPLECDAAAPLLPSQAGCFTMVLDESCYRLDPIEFRSASENPAAALDVNLLQSLILEPVFGIRDSRADTRLAFVNGANGYGAVNHLRAKGWRVAFYCHPPSIEDIMLVSDAGEIMPPKSTCFEPKVRSGLFLRLTH